MGIDIDKLINEYESGLSTFELGLKYGVEAGAIRYRLKKAGIKLRPLAHKRDDKVELPMEQILKEYLDEGISAMKLGIKYKVSYETLRYRLKKEGVQLRKKGYVLDLPIVEIVAEYNAGISAYELCKKYKVTNTTILKRLREAGVQIRPKELGGIKNRANLPMEEVKAEYLAGMSSVALGKKYGVSSITILKRLRGAGVQIRLRGGK
ncbi:hypothetical protein [Listeria booriae]|uniref:hypothetical protein n=1 Tax=Listeria booriae TaxID=1552123 RepID=UPI00162A9E23|nr:hypothetical protein [Listeria booriae]MBC2392006.1 hypothetical protein [Listeria booriae]